MIFGISQDVVHNTKRFLALQFDKKDMGEIKVIMSVKIIIMGNSTMLSQEHYVKKILKRFGHFEDKPMTTPYDANTI